MRNKCDPSDLAIAVHLQGIMLRITIREDSEVIAIKLDGRLGGPWASELDRTWKILASSLGSRKVSLDLCNMTYADADGRKLLREIHEGSGASFIANNPLSEHFAKEAMLLAGEM